jgi:hypothetical protein
VVVQGDVVAVDLHRDPGGASWMNFFFGAEACLGHLSSWSGRWTDTAGYTLGVGNCDASLTPELIDVIEAAIPVTSEGVDITGVRG